MFDEVELSPLLACVGDQWSPTIGDPSLAGWAIVVAYVFCAVLGCITALRVQDGRERFFWGMLTLTMLVLGINKELDLQTLFTATGRCFSQLQDWYDQRRAFQWNFILGLLVASILFIGLVLWLMRGRLRRNGVAILGLAFVTAFVAVRAVGFHHFDALIDTQVRDIRYNVLFELSGLFAIAGNALALL